MRFAEQLFQKRLYRNLRQKQVALDAGIDPSYLAALEHGRRPPPESDILQRLIKTLSMPESEGLALRQAAAIDRLLHYIDRKGGEIPSRDCLTQFAMALPMLSEQKIRAVSILVETLRSE